MLRAVAILDTMWDWEAKTSSAGYAQAPRWFRINPRNFSGRRLYDWVGHRSLLVTDACPELVTSARGRGKPDVVWLHNNLSDLQPFELLLVCGKVAQATYTVESSHYSRGAERVVFLPHPAARMWTRKGLSFARRIIQEGKHDVVLSYRGGRLICTLKGSER